MERINKHLAGTCCGPAPGMEWGTHTEFASALLCLGMFLPGREHCLVALQGLSHLRAFSPEQRWIPSPGGEGGGAGQRVH